MFKTMPKGHASCLAPEFKYTPAAHNDLPNTFARIRRQLTPKAEPEPGDVRPLRQKKSGSDARTTSPGWLKSARASKSVNPRDRHHAALGPASREPPPQRTCKCTTTLAGDPDHA